MSTTTFDKIKKKRETLLALEIRSSRKKLGNV